MRFNSILSVAMVLAFVAPVAAQTGQEKQILTMTRQNWIGFRNYDGQQLVYFTHLEAWRCGIAKVSYSVNDASLDQNWALQPCDPDNPNAVTTGTPYIALPLNTAQTIAIQLTFTDGTTSAVETFSP